MSKIEDTKRSFPTFDAHKIFCERRSIDTPMYMTMSHCHDFFELYYLFEGERKYFIDDNIYLLKKGDFILIPPRTLHRTTFAEQSFHHRMVVYFPARMFDAALLSSVFSVHKLSIPVNKTAYVEGIFSRMEDEQRGDDAYAPRLMEDALFELLVFLARQKKDGQASEDGRKEDAYILKAVKYINSHFDEPLSLRAISERFSLSESYFSRKFKETTGFGFSEFLNYTRILAASRLLLETDDGVSRIAERCGFNDSNYFTVVFKRINGKTPLAYRKSNQPTKI